MTVPSCVEHLVEDDCIQLSDYILHRFIEDGELVRDVCDVLVTFGGRDEWITSMGAVGLVNRCVLMLGRHSDRRDTVLSIVHLLHVLHRPCIQKSFEGSSVVTQLVECSSKYLSDLPALQEILDVLEEMCEFDPERNALGDVVAFLVKGMRSYSNEKPLQRVACVLLARVSENRSNWTSLLKGEGVEAVIVASNTFPEDADIQHHALEFFSRIAADGECRDSLRAHDGVRCILECMATNRTVKHVQQYGALTLRQLTMEESGSNLLTQSKMEVLFSDYKDYKEDEDVMVPVVGIFSHYSEDVSREYVKKMLEKSFLEEVVELLRTRRANAELHAELYELVLHLSEDASANEFFMAQNISALAICSMREELEKDYAGMTAEEKTLSSLLVINLSQTIRRLLKGREVKAVVPVSLLELFHQALEVYHKDDKTTLALLALYEVLVKEESYVESVESKKVLDRMLSLYKECIRSWPIEKSLFKIFRRVSEVKETLAERIVNTGVIEDAALLIQGYARRDQLVKQAMKLFLQLLRLPIAFAHFINSDIVMYVVQLLAVHVENRKVLDLITRTLIELARPDVKEKFVTSDAVTEDLAVMKKYEQTESVQESCLRLLSKLVWIVADFSDDEATEAIETVLVERSSFKENCEIAKHTAIVFNYFAQTAGHRAKVQQSEIVPLLLSGIAIAEDEEAVVNAGEALGAILTIAELVTVFVESNGFPVTLQAFKKFATSQPACVALFHMLSVVLSDKNVEHVETMIMSEGIENLTLPIQSHNEDKELVAASLDVAAKCCVSEMWSGTLSLMDLPLAVLNTLKKWQDEPLIVSPCLVILACAGQEGDTVTLLVENGIYEVTMNALKTHKLNLDVCKGVLLVLHRLTSMDTMESGMDLLAKQPTVDLLIDVISEYFEDHELVVEALGVIENLVSNDKVAVFFLNVPAFETIAKLISKYAEDDSILSVVLKILEYIKYVDADCAMRIQTHFLDVYARLLTVHKEKYETVKVVLELAVAMTMHTEACTEAFPDFIPAVIGCQKQYAEDADVNMLFAKIVFYVSKQKSVVASLYDAKVVPMLLLRLKGHASLSEEEIRYLVCALSYIMVDDETTRYTFVGTEEMEVGDIWYLLSMILYEHFKNGKIGAACCFLMSTATAEDEDIKRLELNKVPGNVYDTMTNNLEMRSTILGAFTFSYRLLMSEHGHGILNHGDCLDMISKGMHAFPQDVAVQLKGVKVLREYSLHKETVKQMEQNGAIECLVESLNVESDDVNSNAFIAMRNLCTNSQEVQVLDATSLPSVDDEVCQVQVVKKVVDSVSRCLFRKIGSLSVITNALELIVCLSACSKPAVSQKVQALFPAMVEYWRSRQDNLDTCVLFCGAFALLALNSTALLVMHSAGVTEIVFQVLGLHQWSDEQMLVPIRLLAYLSRNDEASRYIVLNGLERVMLELNKHTNPGNANIQVSRAGCQLLYSLCERSENHDALIAAKIIPYYQSLIAAYSTDRTILMESLKVLVAFSRTPSDVSMLASQHVTESVLSVVKVSTEQLDYEIVRMCTDVLLPFTSQKTVRAAILEAGVFTTILPLLPRFVELMASDQVAYDFVALLRVVSNTVGVNPKKADVTSVDAKGARLFVEAGGVATLVKLLEKYPSEESVDVIVDVLRRVATSEDSLSFFWESATMTKLLSCYANEKVTAAQMEVMADMLRMLLKGVTVEKAGCVKDTAIFATLVDALQRYVEEAKVVNLLLEDMGLLMTVDPKRFCIPQVTDAVEKVVEKHATHKAICVKLANNLNALCDERRFRHSMWVTAVAKPLSDILLAQPAEEEVAEAVLPVINKLCKHEKVAEAVAKVPTVTAIFGCIKAAQTESVFSLACLTLRLLVRNCPSALSQFVDGNSPRAIYDGLFKYMKSENVVGVACSLLHILLSDNEVGLGVLTLEDIVSMKDLMQQSWSMKENMIRDDVLSMCLAGLNALGNKNKENPKALKRVGAQEVMEQVVRAYSLHSLVHSRMCLGVTAFAAMTEKGQKAVVQTNAVGEGMKALGEFVSDKEVCVNGLNAFRRMMELRAAREEVMHAGVSAILAAMRRFEEEKEVQQYALETLDGLKDHRSFVRVMEAEGGVAAVVGSWKLFAEDRDVVGVGASVLSALTESESCGEEVLESGGVQCMLEVMESFSMERAIMVPVCKLITAMSRNAEAKAKLLEEDTVNTLVMVITAGDKEDAELVGAAVEALMSLVSAPFAEEGLKDADMASMLVNAFLVVLEVDTSATDAACEACMASLQALCEDDQQREEVLTNDVGKVLTKVLQRSSSDVELVTAALALLMQLSQDNTAREDLTDDALVGAVASAMGHYAQSSGVQRASVAWLRLLAEFDYTLEYIATAAVVKALLAALVNCKSSQALVNDGFEALALLSVKPEMVAAMNAEKAGPQLLALNTECGSVKTNAALATLQSALRMKERKHKRHHHHHDETGEKHHHRRAEGEKRHKHHHHRSEKPAAAEGAEGAEGAAAPAEGEKKKHHRRHHSHRDAQEGEKRKHRRHHSHRPQKEGEKRRHHSHRSRRPEKAVKEAISDGADPQGQDN